MPCFHSIQSSRFVWGLFLIQEEKDMQKFNEKKREQPESTSRLNIFEEIANRISSLRAKPMKEEECTEIVIICEPEGPACPPDPIPKVDSFKF